MPIRTKNNGDTAIDQPAETLLGGLEGSSHGAHDDEVDFLSDGVVVLEGESQFIALFVEAPAGEWWVGKVVVLCFVC